MANTKSNITALKSLLGDLNAESLSEDRSNLIPSGVYKSRIEKVEVKQSAKGNTYLSVWHVLSGNEHYDGAYVFDTLNVGHPNPSVRTQAEGALKTLLKTAGIYTEDVPAYELVEALPGLNSTMYVSQQAGRDGYQPRNNVSRYVLPQEQTMREELSVA